MLFPLKITIFAHPNHSGCSSARLEYTSGGRVVAGSNPVIPTKLEQTAEHLFCCFFCCHCVVCKPTAKQQKNLARHACHLLFLWGGWYSLIYGCGDRVISIARLSACALFWLSPRGRSFLLLPSNPVIPTKLEQTAEQCVLLFFCCHCVVCKPTAKQQKTSHAMRAICSFCGVVGIL